MTETAPITIFRAPGRNRFRAILTLSGRNHCCNIGAAGVSAIKREGDRATPCGMLRIVRGYYRRHSGRTLPPAPWLLPIEPWLGWCDDPRHPRYNRPVRLPFDASHERMFRNDGLYDICIVLDWNLFPRSKNRGSAIFLHCSPDGAATAGCVALPQTDLRHLLPFLRPGQRLLVMP